MLPIILAYRAWFDKSKTYKLLACEVLTARGFLYCLTGFCQVACVGGLEPLCLLFSRCAGGAIPPVEQLETCQLQ